MTPEFETTIVSLIVVSGSCRSFSMAAIKAAKEGDFDKAEEFIRSAVMQEQ